MTATFEIIDMKTPEGRAKAAAYEREQAAKITRGQQIWARIRESSKYYLMQSDGTAFPVHIVAGHPESYVVQGGPGGQYRLQDVDLYVIQDGRELRITQ